MKEKPLKKKKKKQIKPPLSKKKKKKKPSNKPPNLTQKTIRERTTKTKDPKLVKGKKSQRTEQK